MPMLRIAWTPPVRLPFVEDAGSLPADPCGNESSVHSKPVAMLATLEQAASLLSSLIPNCKLYNIGQITRLSS